MTCKHAKFNENGHMYCADGQKMFLTKCLKGGCPCYTPKEKGEKKK